MNTTMEQLPRELGISYRQLDYWVRNGWLQPRNAGLGSGTRRQFKGTELTVARRMGQLVNAGITPPLAAKIARASVTRGGYFTFLDVITSCQEEQT